MENENKPGTKRWKLWAGFIALLFIVWFGGWHIMARYGEGVIDEEIAKLAERDVDVRCENRAIRGFPFRAGLFCDSISISDLRAGFKVETGALRSTATLINPTRAIIELDAPLFVSERSSLPTAVHWASFRASIAGNTDGLERFSAVAKGLEAQFPQTLGGVIDGIEVKNGELHLRPTPKNKANDFDLAFSLDDIGPVTKDNLPGDEVSVKADIRIGNAIGSLLAGKAVGVVSGQIRSLTLSVSSGGILRLAGPFEIDEQGLISGTMRLAIAELDRFGETISKTSPQLAETIGPVLASLGSLGKKVLLGDKPGQEITIRLNRGRIMLGLIQLGRIPPLGNRVAGS